MDLLGILAKDERYIPVRQTSVGTPPGTKANPVLGLLYKNLNDKVAVPADSVDLVANDWLPMTWSAPNGPPVTYLH